MQALPSIITQKPITRALCFDLHNTLTRNKSSAGKTLLHRMQKTIRLNELHGTKIPAICAHLESQKMETQLTNEFYATVPLLKHHWPDFGHKHNVDMKLWWKNLVYNVLNNMHILQDPYHNIRDKADDRLQLISPDDAAIDGFAKTDGIMVTVYDEDFPHINIEFNFDLFFDALYNDWCDPNCYEQYPDSRTFIDYIFGHYKDEIVMGCATHDAFHCNQEVLKALKLDYFDFYVTPQTAKCSKPTKKFYEITKTNIYQSIQRRMVEAEINKLYGKQGSLYDRAYRNQMKKHIAEDKQYLLHEQDIKEAYSLRFEQMLGPQDVDIVMIGNSLKDDVLPALDMGWKAVWLLRPPRYNLNKTKIEEAYDEIEKAGTEYFGPQKWINQVKKRALVTPNLFDIHHNAFLWD